VLAANSHGDGRVLHVAAAACLLVQFCWKIWYSHQLAKVAGACSYLATSSFEDNHRTLQGRLCDECQAMAA
jgi:hypothetical protein